MALPGSELLAARHRVVRSTLATLGLDGLVVTSPANIRYLSNHAGSAGTLVLTHSGVHLLIDFRYQESVRATQVSAAACPDLRTWNVPASYDEALIDMLSGPDMPVRLGIEAAHLTVARKEWLERTTASRGLALIWSSTERVVEQFRQIKDASEIAMLRDSAARLSEVADAAFRAIRPGVTEREVAGAIERAMRTCRLRASGVRYHRGIGPQCGAAALPRRHENPAAGRPGRAGLRWRPGRILLRLDPDCIGRGVHPRRPPAACSRPRCPAHCYRRREARSPSDGGRCRRPKRARIVRSGRGVRAWDRPRAGPRRPRRTPDRSSSLAFSFRATGTRDGVYH